MANPKRRRRKNYKNPGDSLDFILAPFMWFVGWIERRLQKRDKKKAPDAADKEGDSE